MEKIAAAVRRSKRPLRGKQNIGLRAGKILNCYKMGKHFQLRIEEDSFHYERKKANIEREQNLDGIYVIRTTVKEEVLSSHEVAASYKSLSGVERAFRSLKPSICRCDRTINAYRTASAPTSCVACWPTTWNGICDNS